MLDKKEIMEFITENDVKFIRLAFCDIFGNLKNISIMPSVLEKAFDSGISFDASSIMGFGDEVKSELFLKPDPSTLTFLPWRPSHGRVVRFYCDVLTPDKESFALDARAMLKRAADTMHKEGYSINFGAELEFYLFKMDENANPTSEPFDDAGYMDVAPADKGENVRREICLTLEEMGMRPERSHHECGPGQNEIDFKYDKAVISADNVITFKSVVSTIAYRNGLYATFAPKPLEAKEGSGFHINMSIRDLNGYQAPKKITESFMAGILKYISDMTLFMNPSVESYKRLGKYKAPKYITWSEQNRSQLIRIPSEDGDYSRLELRSPDCLANPYIVYSLLIYAGLEGIKKSMIPPLPTNKNLFNISEKEAREYKKLPESLKEAVKAAETSDFLQGLKDHQLFAAYQRFCQDKK